MTRFRRSDDINDIEVGISPELAARIRQSAFALTSFGGQPALLRSAGWRMGWDSNPR